MKAYYIENLPKTTASARKDIFLNFKDFQRPKPITVWKSFKYMVLEYYKNSLLADFVWRLKRQIWQSDASQSYLLKIILLPCFLNLQCYVRKFVYTYVNS